MSVKIPLITGTSGIIATAVLLSNGADANTQKNDNLHNIQVYFYDKDKTEKSMRMTLSLPFSQSSMEFPKKVNNETKWEKLEDSISSEQDENKKAKKRAMWNTLFGIASNYIHTQHKLNIIKTNKPEDTDEKNKLKNLCKDGNCCCKKPGQPNCDCTKGNCCKMCLCCYSKKDPSGNCCCKNPSKENCYDDLIKSQKTFRYLRPNINSAWTGQYLQPVEAYIKLPDLTFSELEISDSESTTSSNPEQKPFIGTLVYGFVDYWYKKGKFEGALPQGDASYSTLNSGTEYWFANVPQRFTFTHKKKQDSNDAADTNNHENIETVLKAVESSQKVNKFVQDKSSDPTSCCTGKTNTEEVIKCALSRNYIYLEETSITKTPENMKNISDCCSGQSS